MWKTPNKWRWFIILWKLNPLTCCRPYYIVVCSGSRILVYVFKRRGFELHCFSIATSLFEPSKRKADALSQISLHIDSCVKLLQAVLLALDECTLNNSTKMRQVLELDSLVLTKVLPNLSNDIGEAFNDSLLYLLQSFWCRCHKKGFIVKLLKSCWDQFSIIVKSSISFSSAV